MGHDGIAAKCLLANGCDEETAQAVAADDVRQLAT